MADSLIVLMLSFNSPLVGYTRHYYISENYVYHKITFYKEDELVKSEIDLGDFYIDFNKSEVFYIDKDFSRRKYVGKTLEGNNIYSNSPHWKLETHYSTFLSFNSIVEKYTSKSNSIHSVTFAEIPLFQKYSNKISNIIITGLINKNSEQYNLRVKYKDFQLIPSRLDKNKFVDDIFILEELIKVEEIKVPIDFFDKFIQLPLIKT